MVSRRYQPVLITRGLVKKIHCMVVDLGYDDQSYYNMNTKSEFQLICPIRRYKILGERLTSLLL